MGAESGGTIEPISKADRERTDRSADSARTTTATAQTGDRTGRTDTAGGRTDTTGGKAGEKDGLSVGTEPNLLTDEQKREERNRRRRERYAEQKGTTAKPRKVRKSKTANVIDTTEIDKMLCNLSTIVASRPNMAHWQLTEQEVHTITQPLGNILQKYGLFDKVTENSNEIALAVACVSVFAPRIMVSVAVAKQNAKQKENVRTDKPKIQTGGEKNGKSKTERKIEKSSGSRSGGNATNGADNGVYVPSYYLSGY